MRRTTPLLTILAVLAVAAPAGAAVSGPTAKLEAGLRQCANKERAKRGLPALRKDAALHRAAIRHARDMRNRDYFAHNSQDGRTPWDRIRNALQGERAFGTMGENIAMGYTTAAATCRGWMNSPGHRSNILHRGFTHIGVGWADGYAVQDFGGRR